MIAWCELPVHVQGMILTSMTLTLCFGLYLMPVVLRQKNTSKKLFLCVTASVCFAAVVMLGSGMKASYYSLAQSELTQWCESWPFFIPVLLLAAANTYLISLLVREVRYRNHTITPRSIKESLDHLPTGLCFCDKNGTIMLANLRMYELCQRIIGRDLQNGMLFWEILSKEASVPGAQRLSEGENPSFRLADGTVWSFTRNVEDGVIQLMAADITKLQSLADELTKKNLEQAERNLRLREYRSNVEKLAREQEQLDTKARIHSQFGQALLATWHYLRDEDEADENVMCIWAQTKEALRNASILPIGNDLLKTLQDAARAAGLKLEIRGSLPKEEPAKTLLAEAATEALTNAVRHAQASILYFEIFETPDMAVARFANDGKIPQLPVVEGGGLGALRRKTELAGGTMTIETTPSFVLVLEIPKERSDDLWRIF